MADIYDEGTYRKPNVPRNKQTNTLLVRAPVGQVRPSTHTLPPENFAYGRSDRPADDQGVGMCVGNWKTHLGSKPSSATAAAASKTAAVRNQAHVRPPEQHLFLLSPFFSDTFDLCYQRLF